MRRKGFVRLFKAIVTGLLMAAVVLEPVMAETMTVKAGYNLRMRPDGDIHHENDREQLVTVVERGNDWALVMLNSGKRYWVHSSGLVEHNPDVASDDPGSSGDGGQSFRTIQDNWPVRSRAVTNSRRISRSFVACATNGRNRDRSQRAGSGVK